MMGKESKLVVALLIVMIAVMAIVGRMLVSNKTIKFRSLSHGRTCGVTHRYDVVITSQSDMKALWEQMYGVAPIASAPIIDFDRNVVLAVFQGQKPSDGYEVLVTKVVAIRDRILVLVGEHCPGEGEIVGGAPSQPFDMVIIHRPNLPVDFIWDRTCHRTGSMTSPVCNDASPP